MRRTAAILGVVALAGVAAPGTQAGPQRAGNSPTVKVADDFYSPTKLGVKKGTKVKFRWDGSNTDSHNVTLQKGPGRIKKSDFTSATGSIGVKFVPTFDKPGTYDFVCTIHPDVMKLTVTVKR